MTDTIEVGAEYTPEQWQEKLAEAVTYGYTHGLSQAAWAIDGNTADATKAHIRRMIDDGDPALPDPPAVNDDDITACAECLDVDPESLTDDDREALRSAFTEQYYMGWQDGLDRAV